MGNRQETAELLRQTREAREITLEDVQAKTKIHIGLLRALERGEVPSGINQIYIRGFLKIYANFLGLEPQKVICGFNLSLPAEEKPIKIIKREEPQNAKRVNVSFNKDRLRQALRLLFPILGIVFLIFIIGRIASCRRHAVAGAVKETPVEAPAQSSNLPIEKQSRIKLSIRAKESSWLRVKTDGKTIFQGMFRRGLSETWNAKDKMDLSLGDAGAVELEINGKRIPALGRRGEAVKSVKITKEGLTVGK